jgi:putative transposase
VLLRLAYLGVTNMVAMLRLLPRSDRDKDTEILVLRHQLATLQRRLGDQRVQFQPADRALLAVLLHSLPRPSLERLWLLVRPDTVLRWQCDLLVRQHAARSRPHRRGRPRTLRSIRALVLRLAQENSGWGYRRLHGELLTLGVKVAASTVWQILREAGIHPSPDRTATTWAAFLHSQAHALLAADFIETMTLTGTRMYILAVIEHATRRIRILGATAHPTAAWVTKPPATWPWTYTTSERQYGSSSATATASTPGVRHNPRRQRHRGGAQRRPGPPDERDHGTVGAHLPPRTPRPHLTYDQRHLLHALREYERFYNEHRPTRASATPDPSHHCPNRSPTQTSSPSYACIAVTVSVDCFTNTNMPRDQHGRNSRQVHGCTPRG